jgi:hypothetical protein
MENFVLVSKMPLDDNHRDEKIIVGEAFERNFFAIFEHLSSEKARD